MVRTINSFLFTLILISGTQAFARTSGGAGGGSGVSTLSGNVSIGFLGGIDNTTQDGLNDMQSRANTRESGITTGQLNQALEFGGHFSYRFSGSMFGLQFRPTYFYQRVDGHGSSGSFTYGVQGWTLFPLLKLIPLENEFVKFFMQVGFGYGQVYAMVNEGLDGTGKNRHVDFGSGAFGSMFGMGAEFAYSPSHAFTAEVNYRYLNFQRNVATSATGTFASGSLSQAANGQEVELDNNDLAVRMGGLQFLLGYSFYF